MKAQFTFFLNNIITQHLICKELPKLSFDGIVKILRSRRPTMDRVPTIGLHISCLKLFNVTFVTTHGSFFRIVKEMHLCKIGKKHYLVTIVFVQFLPLRFPTDT